VLAASLAIPVACLMLSELTHGAGPMIPYFDPDGPVYLDFFTAMGALSSLLLVIPGAVAAYRCLGRWAAAAVVVFLLAFCALCASHYTIS